MKPWFIFCFLSIFLVLAWLSYQPLLTYSPELAKGAVVATGHPPSPAVEAPRRTMRICSDLWMPYAGEPGAEYEGYFVDLMREIYEPLGYRIDYVILPWTRCVQDVRDGLADGLVATVYSQTPDLVFPESSLGLDQTLFFTDAKSRWRFTDPVDLDRIKLGVVQDYDYQEWLDLYILRKAATGKIWFARGDYPLERLVTALQDGEIDAFIENPEVVNAYLKQHRGRVRLRTAGSVGPANRLYAAFSPRKTDAEELARVLDRKIDDLRSSGRLQAILGRYGLSDWRTPVPSTGKGGQR